MKLTLKLAVAAALALAGTQAFAQVSVPPPPYNTWTTPASNGGVSTSPGGSALFTLFSTDTTTPFSYDFNLGLKFADLLPSNGMNTPGLTLTWNLTGLSIPSSVVGSTLQWHVSASQTLGSTLLKAGNLNIETTADSSVTAAQINSQTNSNLTSAEQADNSFIQNAGSVGGNPVVSTNASDTYYAPAKYGTTLNALSFQASTGGTTANFYEISSGKGNSLTAATNVEYAGIWTLNLASDTLTYSVAGGAVPLPAGLWLLLSGLTGLGVLGRRKSSSALAA